MKRFVVRTIAAAILTCGSLVASKLAAVDWPMHGRDVTRNPVSPETGAPIDWDVETGNNVKWSPRLGTQTYTAPIVADGHVYVGTNNTAAYLKRYPKNIDLGCLLCFRESDGEFLWQYSAEKLPTGRIHDWPYQGIGSSPLVEGERMWFVSNRWEVICADTQGFRDGENDGPYVDEPVEDNREADVVWKFDLMDELGVQPHTAGMGPDRRCSIAASYKDRIYVVTGNGVDSSHLKIPAPDAPSLVCFHKDTGKALWTDNSPGKNVLHVQIASPLVAEIAGRGQVIVPQGDGWIRSFDALTGELVWKFDVNFKESKWILGGRGDRNNILATPVLYENRVYIASGQEPEHGEGMGRLVCIDPTKKGDVSSELAVDKNGNVIAHRRIQAVDPSTGEKAIPNPNSGLIWDFGAKSVAEYKRQKFEERMHRTISSVAVHDGLVIAADGAGLIHCLDAKTGKQHWTYDAFANIIAAPLIVAGTVYVADEDGDVAVFRLSADPDVAMKKAGGEYQPIAETYMGNAVYCSPTFANGTLYIATRSKLYAIAEQKEQPDKPKGQKTGGYWPQWRGPNRDNVSTGTGLLQQWPEGGPPLLWQAKGLGTGIACLAVADGRIYTVGYQDKSEFAVALDEQTGQLAWATRIGPEVAENRLMRWLAQRSPTVDGDRVYFLTYSGELLCLRAAGGETLWQTSYVNDFGARRHSWGMADYPLVDGERLICAPCGKDATLVALDKNTGNTVWTTFVPHNPRRGFAGTVISEAVGVRQYVTFLGNAVVGVSAQDGKLLWQYEKVANGTGNSHTPIVSGDYVFCSSGYGKGIALLRLVGGEEGVQAQEVYYRRLSVDTFADPTIRVGDYVYSTRSGSVLYCIDWKTGESVWSERTGVRGRASMTYADGRLFMFHSNGTALLVEATPEGYEQRGSFVVPDFEEARGATNPVVAGGRLYLRDEDRLFCYDVREDALQKPRVEPKRVVLPELADAVIGGGRLQDPGSEARRVPKSVFVPTPHDVVDKMLELAAVEKDDVVYDLGSGDGRILIAAAKKYGCQSVGYEIDPDLVKLSREEAQEAKIETLVSIHQADLFTADLSQADVVTLYLLPAQLEKLIPKLKIIKPGARIVAHQFPIPGIDADKTMTMESKESGEKHVLYLWTAPLR